MRLGLRVSRRRRLLVQRLAQSRDELREARRVVRLDTGGAHGADDELERRLYLCADRLRRPEIGRREDGAEHGANVPAGPLPCGDRGIDAAVWWLVRHESRAQLGAHVVHRGVLHRQILQQPNPFVLAFVWERHAEDVLGPAVMRPVAKDESRALLRPLDAPAREDSRDLDDVLLRVTAIDAEGVQLEQLARVILVDSRRLPPAPLLRHLIPAEPRSAEWREELARLRRGRTGRDALRIVEIKEHRGAFSRRDEQIFEFAERPRPDGFFYIRRQQKPIGALAYKDVEMIRPEVDHHFPQLPLRYRRPHDRELLQLTPELPELAHGARPRAVRPHRVAARRRLTLHALPLADRVAISSRQIAAFVVEDLERPLALGEMLVGDVIGIELPFNPAHDPEASDAVGLVRAGAVGEAVESMERGIPRREAGRGLLHD